ncbi:hypothetical protein [Bdellovibrio bacteriovorus]|uniref:hypothetical protein n=1 Tax=Bdellovibrio bacteriovorus TaxID=959 RepID=UPI003AA8CBA8
MRILLATLTLLASSAAFAGNLCTKWEHSDRYTAAIKVVAAQEDFSYDELCTFARILDIEAQPSRVITPKGDVIPHVRIQLHMAYESCLYMVRDADKVITSQRCYSGW